MKVVILAGGLGSRLAEETRLVPKPMVEIGGKPILWHIMSHYAQFGFDDFVIALGYKSEVVKEYFLNLSARHRNMLVDLQTGGVQYQGGEVPRWKVQLVDTGKDTQTGGRLKRLRPFLDGGTFLATYGDGVSDIDINQLVNFHHQHGRPATVTAVRPPSRFGSLKLKGDSVVAFKEKPHAHEGWINGGFFVLEPSVLDYVDGDSMPFEEQPMEKLAVTGDLMAFKHDGFWHPMDTIRDKQTLEDLWNTGRAPWIMENKCIAFGQAA